MLRTHECPLRRNDCADDVSKKSFNCRNYPDFYYKLQFKVPGSDSVIDMLMIDTIVLCGNSDDDRLGKQPSCPKSVADAEQQWTWIEKNLQSSKYVSSAELCVDMFTVPV